MEETCAGETSDLNFIRSVLRSLGDRGLFPQLLRWLASLASSPHLVAADPQSLLSLIPFSPFCASAGPVESVDALQIATANTPRIRSRIRFCATLLPSYAVASVRRHAHPRAPPAQAAHFVQRAPFQPCRDHRVQTLHVVRSTRNQLDRQNQQLQDAAHVRVSTHRHHEPRRRKKPAQGCWADAVPDGLQATRLHPLGHRKCAPTLSAHKGSQDASALPFVQRLAAGSIAKFGGCPSWHEASLCVWR
ncbi:hypothetical protein BDU57DRAFT_238086 [Ampelomyces quisqualis]|uniref:Uncharacterized protein n=1 Tax=Ampelomyces quisqualis TaxID=50730 RepID=A0A6A5QPH3_AMPQU|nr:hypothetical protein BDU57DRAFT_238086 [Ampelomyces quisqualis]